MKIYFFDYSVKTRLKSHCLNQFKLSKPNKPRFSKFTFKKCRLENYLVKSWLKITKNYKILVLLSLNTVYFFVRENFNHRETKMILLLTNNSKSFANWSKSIVRNNLGFCEHPNTGVYPVNVAKFLRTTFYM